MVCIFYENEYRILWFVFINVYWFRFISKNKLYCKILVDWFIILIGELF